GGVQRSIELERVPEGRQHGGGILRWQRELVHPRSDYRQRVVLERGRVARLLLPQPVVVERHAGHARAVRAERMKVAVPEAGPVDELDPQLERGLRPRHELTLVDADALVEEANVRQRGLTYADDADL